MITTNTGAKKLESSDNWREIFPDNQGAQGAHNASVGAHDAAICQTCQTINGTTNNSGHTINSGEYFIANGGKYKATASIPNGEPWASSAEAVTDNDLIGALNNNLTNYMKIVSKSLGGTGTVAANTSKSFYDVDVSSDIPSGYKLFDCLPGYPGDKQFIFVSTGVTTSTTINAEIYNTGATATSGTASVRLICILNL